MKKIKLPTGAEAEVVEHAPGEWFGRVPAHLEDWHDTGEAQFVLAETEALWAENIARNREARKNNARKISVEDVVATFEVMSKKMHRRPTMAEAAERMECDERSIRRALRAAGMSWKRL